MSKTRNALRLGLLALALAPTAGGETFAGESGGTSYNFQVRPILAAKCYECHGPDAESREAGLRLDIQEGATALLKSGKRAIAPKGPGESELLHRVTTDDASDRMPPPDDADRLSAEEVDILTRWITEGAEYEPHWAFSRLVRPTPPDLVPEETGWARTPIDNFIRARHRELGIEPAPEADRRTLIRRLHFDLWGLPPSPEEVEEFVADPSPDAYERLVDRLLDSPRYGERWARHWLDIAHYGDTHGFDKDKPRPNAYRYRDYVIQSLNEDKPYHRFAREQVAGDALWPEDAEAVAGSGFLAAGPWDWVGHVELREGTLDKKIVRNLDRDDMVRTVVETFNSVTVGCARCHDHKFDPISQRDYYSLQAVFAGVERGERALPPSAEQRRKKVELEAARHEAEEIRATMAACAGPRLAEIDAEIQELRNAAEASAPPPDAPRTLGYHSAIEKHADRPKWVQVDLGRSTPIDSVIVVPANESYGGHQGAGFVFPPVYRIEASNDADFADENIELASYSRGANEVVREPDFIILAEPVSARYVRVSVPLLRERKEDYCFALGELIVMSEGENAARQAAVTALDSIEAGNSWGRRFLTDGFFDNDSLPNAGAKHLNVFARLKALEKDREALSKQAAPELAAKLGELEQEAAALDAELASAAPRRFYGPVPLDQPRKIHFLHRGSEKNPGEEMVPGTHSALEWMASRLPVSDSAEEGRRRVALADWIVAEENALTWRSIVNRAWQHHFGRGIVDTPNDFGLMGGVPTHPELLDWLAVEFRDGRQSLKALHRLIVTSAVYRQSSRHHPAYAEIDGGNQFLWRANRRKMEAEVVRDAMLVASGEMDWTMYGPGDAFFIVEQPQHSPHYKYERFDPADAERQRRSIYRFIVRSVPDPFFENLDCADASQIVAKRNRTLTAPQALALLNNKFVIAMAEGLANRVEQEMETPTGQVRRAFELALSRPPIDAETAVLLETREALGLPYLCRNLFNLNEFIFVD